MFPGYVTMFKDKENFIHLYFYQGIDENGEYYYKDLDLTNSKIEYTEIINDDNSKEYVFTNKNIIKITCKLIDNKGNLHIKELSI